MFSSCPAFTLVVDVFSWYSQYSYISRVEREREMMMQGKLFKKNFSTPICEKSDTI